MQPHEPFSDPEESWSWRDQYWLCVLAAKDPELPPGRRLWASWMAGEMLAARTVTAADVLRAGAPASSPPGAPRPAVGEWQHPSLTLTS